MYKRRNVLFSKKKLILLDHELYAQYSVKEFLLKKEQLSLFIGLLCILTVFCLYCFLLCSNGDAVDVISDGVMIVSPLIRSPSF